MSEFPVFVLDLFTGSAGAAESPAGQPRWGASLGRMPHRGERIRRRRVLSFGASVRRRTAGEGARSLSESVEHRPLS